MCGTMSMYLALFSEQYSYGRPVETGDLGGGGGGRVLQPSHIFAKIDLLPIDNESKKKKVAKKYKPL